MNNKIFISAEGDSFGNPTTAKILEKHYVDKKIAVHGVISPIDHSDGSVTTDKIADGAITPVKLSKTYVEAVTGKGLSDNNYTTAEKTKLAGLSNADVNKTYVDTELAKKADNVPGKGLSDNNYTNTEKAKLAGIEAGAQVNPAELPPTDGSVTAEKIAECSVTPAKLDRTYAEIDEYGNISATSVDAEGADIGDLNVSGTIQADNIFAYYTTIQNLDADNLTVMGNQLSPKTQITDTPDQLANNTETRLGEAGSFAVDFPSSFANDYISSLVFTSGASTTNLSYTKAIKWSGDDLDANNVFVPSANKHYTICFWFDGEDFLNAVVRGVSV